MIAQAIADVARQEYRRLASGLQPFEIMERLTKALVELRGLSRGDMPSYSPWVTLCYLTWYQPHHVNLAYTILGELPDHIRKTLIEVQTSDRFRWIDFGCGSLPMHVALYAASSIGRILASPQSRILGSGIDSSNHMLRIGRQLVETINEIDPRLMRGSESLSTGADSMQASPASAGIPTILSVMHAFYRENISEVSNALASLITARDPKLIFVTAHSSSEALVECAFSRHKDRYEFVSKRFDYAQSLRFNGELTSLTALREELAQLITIERANVVNEGLSARRDDADVFDSGAFEWDGGSHSIRKALDGSDLQFIDDTGMAVNYLSKSVLWSGAEVEARIYFKK